MELKEVQAYHFYRLQSGQIARVTGTEGHWVQCELYDESKRAWVKAPTLMPPQSFVEQCGDPSFK